MVQAEANEALDCGNPPGFGSRHWDLGDGGVFPLVAEGHLRRSFSVCPRASRPGRLGSFAVVVAKQAAEPIPAGRRRTAFLCLGTQDPPGPPVEGLIDS